ncbi:MAG: histidine phosphatase family protein [Candidatus Harrisonbacteria bacterium]|nr:histidine phosphatase family protein [Candidatus Harrisonbacteria bacterium]
MSLKTLILIRHAESLRNVVETGTFYKNNQERDKVGLMRDCLVPLTEKGRRQARKTGRALKKRYGVPDYFFYSPYVRAKDTMNDILGAYNPEEVKLMSIKEELLIRERDSGYCHNLIEAEIRQNFPWFLEYWHWAPILERVPIGGESILQIAEGRLSLFLKKVRELPCELGPVKIAVVSHGRAIIGLRYLLEGWDYERANYEIEHNNPRNSSVTVYTMNCFGDAKLEFTNKVFY